jgi:hypothetical protein
MTQEELAQTQPQNGSDIWVAIGVVAFLGLGAGATYWMTRNDVALNTTPTQPIKGLAMNREISPTPNAQNTDGTPKLPELISSETNGEYMSVGFDTLASYFYQIPDLEDTPEIMADPKFKNQIPQPIKELDGKRVGVKGYMLATSQFQGGIKTFMLVRNQDICCLRRAPRMNEWMSVAMKDNKTARLVSDQPVTVFGILHVGEHIEKGTVLNVYRLDAEEVAGPLDL